MIRTAYKTSKISIRYIDISDIFRYIYLIERCDIFRNYIILIHTYLIRIK